MRPLVVILLVAFVACQVAKTPDVGKPPTDDAFAKICFVESTTKNLEIAYWPDYDNVPQCSNWTEIRWGDQIRYSVEMDHPDYMAINRAFRWWNYQLGRKVFVEVDVYLGEAADVLVVSAIGAESGDTLAAAKIGKYFGFQNGVIVTYKELKGGDLNLTYRHEIGHILGLVHDRYRGSLMYPHMHKGMSLTPQDKKALRAVYSP